MWIPQPKISGVCDIEKVLSTQTHSKDEIKRFKILVREGYLKYLDWSIPIKLQTQENLDRFNHYVLSRDMKMYQYSFHWPIGAYAKIWGANYRYRKAGRPTEVVANAMASAKRSQKPKRRNTRTVCNRQIREGAIATTSTSRGRKSSVVTFVGKLPPRMKVFSSSDTQEREEPIMGTETTNEGPQKTHTNSSFPRSEAVAAPLSENTPLDPKISTCSGAICPRPSDENKLDLKCYPSPCAYCGYLPTIPSEIRLALYDLFFAIPHVVPILARSGLVHDRHLEMLRAWKKEDRQEFCDRLPRGSFSALDIAVITDLLVNFPRQEPTTADDTASGSATGEEVESVPWPDTALKTLLKTSSNFMSDLQRAMRLDGNKAFFTRIIDLCDQYGKDFFQNYKSFDQASFQQLRKTIRLIREEEPRLQRYEDAWPVRFYLQRRVKDLAREAEDPDPAITMTPSQASTPPSVATKKTQDMQNPLIVTHSGCPVHFYPDSSQVSQFMRDFFGEHGMQELVAPLAANGVFTEKQFVLFRSLTPGQRENLVARTDHDVKPFLNLFQCMLLKIALRL